MIGNFVTSEEEIFLTNEINKESLETSSQSGRRKQDFGPKVNFKKKKIKVGDFNGLPAYSKFIVERMNLQALLKYFLPVELCNLEYTPERGSSIDPHIDDTWLWGEHLVTVNLLSRTLLTLTEDRVPSSDNTQTSSSKHTEIQIPLSAQSLVILHSEARYKWQHCIRPNHIIGKRLAMTFRNLSHEFHQNGEQYQTGKLVLDVAQSFTGKVLP